MDGRCVGRSSIARRRLFEDQALAEYSQAFLETSEQRGTPRTAAEMEFRGIWSVGGIAHCVLYNHINNVYGSIEILAYEDWL